MATATKETQRTTLYLDSDLHQAAKLAAVEDRVSLTSMMEQALREFLERRKKARTR
jgi:predicted HicB family RNase H-like nuclease